MTEAPAATMGSFRKYDHLERGKHPDVSDLAFGTVHVFPKIDGTNASVWACPTDDPTAVGPMYEVQCGSRTRTLSAEADNAGFHTWVHGDSEQAIALRTFALANPHLIVYGEWLVPHTLRTYKEEAWRRFYVFDVFTHATGRYLPYDGYADTMAMMGIDTITPLAIIENPSENELIKLRDETNTWMISDGVGEGIVLKNYTWANKWGRQPWSKMVRETFKGGNPRPKVRDGGRRIEQEIVEAFCSDAFIKKTFAKVVNAVAEDMGVHLVTDDFDMNNVAEGPTLAHFTAFVETNRHKVIPRFIGTVYWDFIEEETRGFVKKLKNPIVDFSKLQKLVTLAAKRVMKEIF